MCETVSSQRVSYSVGFQGWRLLLLSPRGRGLVVAVKPPVFAQISRRTGVITAGQARVRPVGQGSVSRLENEGTPKWRWEMFFLP